MKRQSLQVISSIVVRLCRRRFESKKVATIFTIASTNDCCTAGIAVETSFFAQFEAATTSDPTTSFSLSTYLSRIRLVSSTSTNNRRITTFGPSREKNSVQLDRLLEIMLSNICTRQPSTAYTSHWRDLRNDGGDQFVVFVVAADAVVVVVVVVVGGVGVVVGDERSTEALEVCEKKGGGGVGPESG